MWFLNIYLRGTHYTCGGQLSSQFHNFWDKIVSQRLRKMLFAKKQFVRFKYARELFSFLELECDWHFFRRLVRLGKVFFCTESTIWNPSAAHRFKEKNSSTLPKKLIHLHTTSQFTAKYASSSWNWHHIQFTNHPTHYVGEFTKIFAGTY